jgi:hypothetical protein
LKGKKRHIDKYRSAKLPEPDVSAEEAWSRMNDMLEQTSNPDAQTSPKKPISALFKTLIILSIIISTVLLLWLFPKNKEHDTSRQNQKKRNGVGVSAAGKQKQIKTLLATHAARGGRETLFYADENKIKPDQPDKSLKSPVSDARTSPFNRKPKKRNVVNSGKNDGNLVEGEPDLSPALNPEVKAEGNQSSRKFFTPRSKNDKAEPVKEKSVAAESQTVAVPDLSTGRDLSTLRKIKYPDPEFNRLGFSVRPLRPKPLQLRSYLKDLAINSMKGPIDNSLNTRSQKKNSAFLSGIHFGPEWSLGSAFNSSKHALARMNGVLNPYLSLIPGIWINYRLNKRQSFTVSFVPFQSYSGGLKDLTRLREVTPDSIPWRDSIITYRNIKLVRAAGLNVGLQYHYHLSSLVSIGAGLSFSPFRSALLNGIVSDATGNVLSDTLTAANRGSIRQYLRTNLFAVKTSLTFSPGKYEFGVNLLLPITNLSVTPATSVRPLNGQVFFRWRLK